MAFTLHFQRRTQSLRTGEGVGLGGQGPSLACPGTLCPTPPTPHPMVDALRESSPACSGPQVIGLFYIKLGCCRSSVPPPNWGAGGRGRKTVAFQDSGCQLYNLLGQTLYLTQARA